MKLTFLKKQSKSETAQCKQRIQSLCRAIALIRDGDCVLRGETGFPPCGGKKRDRTLIYQYDHLNSREHNVSYADTLLGVLVCKGHHGWKHFTDNNKKMYDAAVRKKISVARVKLWDEVEADRKVYPMCLADWVKEERALRQELKKLKHPK